MKDLLTPVVVWDQSDLYHSVAVLWLTKENVLTEVAFLVKNLAPRTSVLMVDTEWTYRLGM